MKPGDTVVLNSGGPPMTVEDVRVDPKIGEVAYVIWFAGEKCDGRAFRTECLRVVERPERRMEN